MQTEKRITKHLKQRWENRCFSYKVNREKFTRNFCKLGY